MSNLISGKEALVALANGEEVQASVNGFDWRDSIEFGLVYFLNGDAYFRLKPKTILINGVEVPAPFKPKIGDIAYSLHGLREAGYEKWIVQKIIDGRLLWRTEDEIKQVVEALRKVFNQGDVA